MPRLSPVVGVIGVNQGISPEENDMTALTNTALKLLDNIRPAAPKPLKAWGDPEWQRKLSTTLTPGAANVLTP